MPEFIAVQCFQCNHFQVTQKRKDGKFNCKLCGSKQSVRKIAARSNKAADVRKFVQKLNLTRGQAEERFDEIHRAHSSPDNCEPDDAYDDENAGGIGNLATHAYESHDSYEQGEFTQARNQEHGTPSASRSKWASYESVLAQSEKPQPDEDDEGQRLWGASKYDLKTDEGDFVTALPDKCTRGSGKRKRRGRTDRPASSEAKRRGFARPEDRDRASFEDRPTRRKAVAGPSEPPSHFHTSNAHTGAMYRNQERQSRWGNTEQTPRSEFRSDDIGDGMFTSLGQDAVVNEEIEY